MHSVIEIRETFNSKVKFCSKFVVIIRAINSAMNVIEKYLLQPVKLSM